ncbi:MAG: peptide-methionine (S)-S-oxide reductase MsrA [Novosphingobium sp.]
MRFFVPLALVAAAATATTIATQQAASAERVVLAPAAVRGTHEPAGLKTAIFAGGCFWGVEGVFSHVDGVTSAVTGYHGGRGGNVTYERVRTGTTGYAESVRVTYDPTRVRYDQLLRIFFSVVADPTQLNRQGPDTGTQYRSALVPTSEEQRLAASAYLAQLRASGLWRAPIVTRIEGQRRFYPAEDYHQDFIAKNPDHPYILAWDMAKIRALRRLFPALYRNGFTRG